MKSVYESLSEIANNRERIPIETAESRTAEILAGFINFGSGKFDANLKANIEAHLVSLREQGESGNESAAWAAQFICSTFQVKDVTVTLPDEMECNG